MLLQMSLLALRQMWRSAGKDDKKLSKLEIHLSNDDSSENGYLNK